MSDQSSHSDGHLRVGDAEREIVIGRLSLAHSLGQLDAEEYAERNEAAVHAKTRDDLAVLTADLPDPDGPEADAPVPTSAFSAGVAKIEEGARRAWGSHKVLTAVGIVLLLNMIGWTIAGLVTSNSGDYAQGRPGPGGGYGPDGYGPAGGYAHHADGAQFLIFPLLIALFVAVGMIRRRSHHDR